VVRLIIPETVPESFFKIVPWRDDLGGGRAGDRVLTIGYPRVRFGLMDRLAKWEEARGGAIGRGQ
jgi:hypothetical protein